MNQINLNIVFEKLMADQHLNQKQLAEILSISQSTMSILMAGKGTIDLNAMKILSDRFNINCDEFIKGNLIYKNDAIIKEDSVEYKSKIKDLENELEETKNELEHTKEDFEFKVNQISTDIQFIKYTIMNK